MNKYSLRILVSLPTPIFNYRKKIFQSKGAGQAIRSHFEGWENFTHKESPLLMTLWGMVFLVMCNDEDSQR